MSNISPAFKDSYAIRLSSYDLSEIDALIVTCEEPGALPPDAQLDKFGTCAIVQASYMSEFFEHPESPLINLICALCRLCHNLSNIVICSHSRCSLDCRSSNNLPGHDRRSQFKKSIKARNSPSREPGLQVESAVQSGAMSIDELRICSIIRNLVAFRDNGVLALPERLNAFGCIWEADIDWMSVYDPEIDIFIPVDSVAELRPAS